MNMPYFAHEIEPEPHVVALRDVNFVRDSSDILNNIELEIHEGDRWAILGPNGAGKTSLLKILAARMHPSSGQVNILNERLGAVDIAELRPRIGFASISEADRIPGSEKVLDAVMTAVWGVNGRWEELYDDLDIERAQELIKRWGIDGLEQQRFSTLSQGEKQRVLICRALMSDPELLLLDEPTVGLDLGGREDMIARLTNLANDSSAPTTILVTHHVEEIPPGFSHALLLKEGHIHSNAPIEEAITAKNLSSIYGIDVELSSYDGRFFARASQKTD